MNPYGQQQGGWGQPPPGQNPQNPQGAPPPYAPGFPQQQPYPGPYGQPPPGFPPGQSAPGFPQYPQQPAPGQPYPPAPGQPAPGFPQQYPQQPAPGQPYPPAPGQPTPQYPQQYPGQPGPTPQYPQQYPGQPGPTPQYPQQYPGQPGPTPQYPQYPQQYPGQFPPGPPPNAEMEHTLEPDHQGGWTGGSSERNSFVFNVPNHPVEMSLNYYIGAHSLNPHARCNSRGSISVNGVRIGGWNNDIAMVHKKANEVRSTPDNVHKGHIILPSNLYRSGQFVVLFQYEAGDQGIAIYEVKLKVRAGPAAPQPGYPQPAPQPNYPQIPPHQGPVIPKKPKDPKDKKPKREDEFKLQPDHQGGFAGSAHEGNSFIFNIPSGKITEAKLIYYAGAHGPADQFVDSRGSILLDNHHSVGRWNNDVALVHHRANEIREVPHNVTKNKIDIPPHYLRAGPITLTFRFEGGRQGLAIFSCHLKVTVVSGGHHPGPAPAPAPKPTEQIPSGGIGVGGLIPGFPGGFFPGGAVQSFPCPKCQGKGAFDAFGKPCEKGAVHYRKDCATCNGARTTTCIVPCPTCGARGGIGAFGPCEVTDVHFRRNCTTCNGKSYLPAHAKVTGPCNACQSKGAMGAFGPCTPWDVHFRSLCNSCQGRGHIIHM